MSDVVLLLEDITSMEIIDEVEQLLDQYAGLECQQDLPSTTERGGDSWNKH